MHQSKLIADLVKIGDPEDQDTCDKESDAQAREDRETAAPGQDARTDISAIKVFVPAAFHRVVDRAIQVWGAAGVSGDLPLAAMYQGARTLRLADGPDEVHQILIAKNVLNRYRGHEQGWDFGN